MSRERLLCFVLCFLLLLTTGYWDRKELNDRAIPLATGCDIFKSDGLQTCTP